MYREVTVTAVRCVSTTRWQPHLRKVCPDSQQILRQKTKTKKTLLSLHSVYDSTGKKTDSFRIKQTSGIN